jgi:hypothetical protein
MENNIGKMNAIFMQNTSKLLKRKNGTKLMKEFVSIIKENKILLKEYMVFDYIENAENNENLKDCVSESINYLKGVKHAELNILNDKLAKFMFENKILQIEDIKNEKLYENISDLIYLQKKVNLKAKMQHVEKLNEIVNYIKENKAPIDNNKDEIISIPINEDIDSFLKFTIDKFNKKYENQLNEDQKKLFKTITASKTEDEMKKIFEDRVKECLELTNVFLKEEIDSVTKEKLLNVKEKLMEQTFNKESYVEDILSLVDLKQTLSE